MFDTTITLFNYHESTDTWFKTVIENVNCIINEAASPTTRGLNDVNTADIKIQTAPDKSIVDKGGSQKTYVGPKMFAEDNAPGDKFTFTPEKDFVMVGDFGSLPTRKDDDYATGLYDELNGKYDNVYIVQKSVYFGLIPHFEVGGR